MKINWKAIAAFSGVAGYYFIRALILVFTNMSDFMLYIYMLLAFLTLAFLAIWLLTDWVLYLNRRCDDLRKSIDEVISAVNLKFECVEENLDRLYINDVIHSKRRDNDK